MQRVAWTKYSEKYNLLEIEEMDIIVSIYKR